MNAGERNEKHQGLALNKPTLSETIAKVMQENEEFLEKYAHDEFFTVVKLANHAIDYLGPFVRHPDSVQFQTQYAMAYYAVHVSMPFSYALGLNLLSGNIPGSFMTLRFLLESMAICYLADIRHKAGSTFEERIALFEVEREQKKWGFTKCIRIVGKDVGIKQDIGQLYQEFSNQWVHARGVMKTFTDSLVRGALPAWSLVIPAPYSADDLPEIHKLAKDVLLFDDILKMVLRKFWERSP